jgi:hypothetical protein
MVSPLFILMICTLGVLQSETYEPECADTGPGNFVFPPYTIYDHLEPLDEWMQHYPTATHRASLRCGFQVGTLVLLLVLASERFYTHKGLNELSYKLKALC